MPNFFFKGPLTITELTSSHFTKRIKDISFSCCVGAGFRPVPMPNRSEISPNVIFNSVISVSYTHLYSFLHSKVNRACSKVMLPFSVNKGDSPVAFTLDVYKRQG